MFRDHVDFKSTLTLNTLRRECCGGGWEPLYKFQSNFLAHSQPEYTVHTYYCIYLVTLYLNTHHNRIVQKLICK